MPSSGNIAILSPILAQATGKPDLARSGSLTHGNLKYVPSSYGIIMGSMGVTTGKWYWELRATGANASGPVVGWLNERHNSGGSGAPSPGYSSPSSQTDAQFIMIYMIPGSGPSEIVAGTPSGSSSGTDTDKSGITTNDIIGVAGDFDNDKWYFSINGSFTDFRSGQNPATGANPLCSGSSGGGTVTFTRVSGLTWYPTYGNWSASGKSAYLNFGQDSTFGGNVTAGGNADENGFGDFKYSVPAGFLTMCSGNHPISANIDPAQTSSNFPQEQFNALAYTGNGSDGNSISGVGFQPYLVWVKNRDAANSHQIYDSSRGTGKLLSSDNTDAEQTYSTVLQSFDSDGFTAGTSAGINGDGNNLIAWCWRANGGTTASNGSGSITSTVQANQAAGFSIITFTSPSSTADQTVGHGLSAAPEFVIAKKLNSSANWNIFHKDLSANEGLRFTSATPISSAWGSMSATTIGVKSPYSYASGDNYVHYAWHGVEGYSKFGSYFGNADDDGTFVYCGFRPRLVFCKNIIQSGAEWSVHDSGRNTTNPVEKELFWDANTAEGSNKDIDFLSNGFKLRKNLGSTANAVKYIFGAWGDVPAKYGNSFG